MREYRRYLDLTPAQRERLFAFTYHHDPERFPDAGAMERAYLSAAFEHGESQFTLWDGGEPIAAMGAVIREAPLRGETFVTAVALDPTFADVFRPLLERTMACMPDPRHLVMRMGISPRHPHVEALAAANGFAPEYEGLILTHQPGHRTLPADPEWRVEVVNLENREAYRQVLDEAFRHSPNGATVDLEQIIELMAEIKFPDLLGLAYWNDVPAAAFELDLQGDVGWIESLAVARAWQGKGMGKRMLVQAIDRLVERGAQTVKLLVMSTNVPAVELYRRHGFGSEEVTARWWRWGGVF